MAASFFSTWCILTAEILIVVQLKSSYCLFVHLKPFMKHAEDCYTHFIIYKPSVNLLSIESPIVISTSKNRDSRIVKRISGVDVPLHFFTKQMRCLAVFLIYTRNRKEVGDAYNYIENHWQLIWTGHMLILPARVVVYSLVSPNVGTQCKPSQFAILYNELTKVDGE